jgi:FtsH-binding integral membrane protein
MGIYNKIMKYFWLGLGIVLCFIVTYNSFTQGFNRWGSYYWMVALAFGMFFLKHWMMKRFENHAKFLKDQENSKTA